jgi:hypothetical protein
MTWSKGLGWAAFVFMALAIAAGGYAKTDFHSVQAVLAASVAVFTGLAGLCLHPPWAGAPPAPGMTAALSPDTPAPAPAKDAAA